MRSEASQPDQVQSEEGKKKKKHNKDKKKQLAANLIDTSGGAKAATRRIVVASRPSKAKLVDDANTAVANSLDDTCFDQIDSADILIESNIVVDLSENVLPSTSSIKKPKKKEKNVKNNAESIAKKDKKDKQKKDSIKIGPNEIEFDYNTVEKIFGSYDYFSKISL